MGRSNKDTVALSKRALGIKKEAIKKAGKNRPTKEILGSDLSDFDSDDDTVTKEKPKAEEDPAEETHKRKRRYRPGTVALRDIKKAQKSCELSFKKTPWRRLVKEIIQDLENDPSSSFSGGYRVTENAYDALQEYSEAWLTSIFRESNRSARNAHRVKITPGDFRLVHDLAEHGLEELMFEQYRFNFDGATVAGEKEPRPSRSE